MAAKKKSAKATPLIVHHDFEAAPSGAQLSTDAIFGDSAGNVWVHCSDAGDHVAYRMPETTEVLELSHGNVRDGFTDANGVAILATTARHPLLRCADGKFEVLPLRIDGSPRSARIASRGDRLAVLVGFSHVGEEKRSAELWVGPPEAMRPVAIDVAGEAIGVAFGEEDDEIWAAVQGRRWAGFAPTLLRVTEGKPAKVGLPSDDLDIQGLARTPRGDLLVMLAKAGGDDGPATVWLHDKDGAWKALGSDPLVGWVGTFALRAHGDKVYIPTQHGVFAYANGKLVKESAFYAVSLWPCGERIVARGYRQGSASHDVSAGDGTWRPFAVPEPDVVFGGKGKVKTFGGKKIVPVRRVRLPIPKAPPAKPQVSTTSNAFAFDAWLRDLAKRPGAKPRKKSIDVVARVEADIGGPIAVDLRRYLEVVGRFDLGEVATGLWFHMNATDDDFLDTSSVERFVTTGLRFHANALGVVTDTLNVGGDGSGNAYCLELGPDRSRVFLFDHDTGRLEPLADSLTTFAELTDVMQRWIDLEEAEGIDIDDFDAKAPSFVAIRERVRALAGRVNPAGDFQDTLPVLAGKKLSYQEKSETLALSDGRAWIGDAFLLERGSIVAATKAAKAERARKTSDRPSRHVYALLHHFLLGETAELGRALEAAASHPARVVRVTADAVRAVKTKEAKWLAAVRAATD